MSLKVQDGKGSGRLAGVSLNNRLETSSRASHRSFYVSRDEGQSYTWTSTYSAATTNEVLYIKNTSKTLKLYLDSIDCNQVGGVIGAFIIKEVTGTAAGTAITGTNTNLVSGNVAPVTALGNASVTGTTDAATISTIGVEQYAHNNILFPATIILGLNDAIAVEFTGSTGVVNVTMHGWFEVE
jgi:hypothetical protein